MFRTHNSIILVQIQFLVFPMINNFKNAIRNKKLYFIVNSNITNINQLSYLLANKLILGYYNIKSNKQAYFLIIISYSCNFNSIIKYGSTNLKRLSKYQNLIIYQTGNQNSNFVLNMNPIMLRNQFKSKHKKPKYKLKFR